MTKMTLPALAAFLFMALAKSSFAADAAMAEAAVDAAEPFGCLISYSTEPVSDSVFMVTGTEKFLACFRKGDYGTDTANRSIPSGTQTLYKVECDGDSCAVTCRTDQDGEGACTP